MDYDEKVGTFVTIDKSGNLKIWVNDNFFCNKTLFKKTLKNENENENRIQQLVKEADLDFLGSYYFGNGISLI